nr:HesB/YadR/YfhF family protein [uncultured Bacillus sp.]
MKIIIRERAMKWFKEEMELKKGDYVRFYTQFYGSSPVQETYSLGFTKDEPIDLAVSVVMEGITFFIEESDLWYFDRHDLQVDYNEKNDEIEYQYLKSGEI